MNNAAKKMSVITQPMYIASDGTSHADPSDCISHECKCRISALMGTQLGYARSIDRDEMRDFIYQYHHEIGTIIKEVVDEVRVLKGQAPVIDSCP